MLERFNLTVHECRKGHQCNDMTVYENGDWVKYADAQATIADLQRQVAIAKEGLPASTKELIDAKEACRALQQRVAQLEGERAQVIAGGITEDLLREGDGYLKIGKGCVVLREDEWAEAKADHARVLGLVQDLKAQAKDYEACRDVLDRTVLDLTTLRETVYATALGMKWYLQYNLECPRDILLWQQALAASLPAQPAQGGV